MEGMLQDTCSLRRRRVSAKGKSSDPFLPPSCKEARSAAQSFPEAPAPSRKSRHTVSSLPPKRTSRQRASAPAPSSCEVSEHFLQNPHGREADSLPHPSGQESPRFSGPVPLRQSLLYRKQHLPPFDPSAYSLQFPKKDSAAASRDSL